MEAPRPGELPMSVAFYLPQFHPIPENNEWWGEGFTEWINVRRGRPLFRGHQQPKVPTELGYYDLRDPAVRAAQAELAREYGIGAFCYYHYWFNGRRLLEHPLNEVLRTGEPDLPFMLCWANENWTRAWDGGSQHILMEQHYTDEDDAAHFRHIAPILEDKRYVRLNGRPVILIYRVGHIPDVRRTADTWRRVASELGVAEPWLCLVESHGEGRTPESLGLDAAVEFIPQFEYLPFWRLSSGKQVGLALRGLIPLQYLHHVFRYSAVRDRMMAKPTRDYPWYRTIAPGWDNSARRNIGALILRGNTPAHFEKWATEALQQSIDVGSPFVFINAWNEWGEGTYLEPDTHWGRGFLEAHLRSREAVAARIGVRSG